MREYLAIGGGWLVGALAIAVHGLDWWAPVGATAAAAAIYAIVPQ